MIRLEVGERPFCLVLSLTLPLHHSLPPSPSFHPHNHPATAPRACWCTKRVRSRGGRGGLNEGEGLQAMVHIYISMYIYICILYIYIYICTGWYIYIYIWHIDIPALQYRKQFRPELNRRRGSQQHGEPSGAHIFVRDCRLSETLREYSWFERGWIEGGWKIVKLEDRENFFRTIFIYVSVGNGASRRIVLKERQGCVLRV